MNAAISPGTRVRVVIPWNAPCPLHCLADVPVLSVLGTVERIEAAWDHPVVVVFDLWHLGTQWVDRFASDELVVVDPSWRHFVWRQLAERTDHAVVGMRYARPGEGVDDELGAIPSRLDLRHSSECVDAHHPDGLADAW